MRNRAIPPIRSVLVVSAAVVAVLTTGTGVAAGAESGAAVQAETTSFGLLGPVGLVAVVLGVVGMALGVLRQRRKSQAVAQPKAEPPTVPAADPVRPALTGRLSSPGAPEWQEGTFTTDVR